MAKSKPALKTKTRFRLGPVLERLEQFTFVWGKSGSRALGALAVPDVRAGRSFAGREYRAREWRRFRPRAGRSGTEMQTGDQLAAPRYSWSRGDT